MKFGFAAGVAFFAFVGKFSSSSFSEVKRLYQRQCSCSHSSPSRTPPRQPGGFYTQRGVFSLNAPVSFPSFLVALLVENWAEWPTSVLGNSCQNGAGAVGFSLREAEIALALSWHRQAGWHSTAEFTPPFTSSLNTDGRFECTLPGLTSVCLSP